MIAVRVRTAMSEHACRVAAARVLGKR